MPFPPFDRKPPRRILLTCPLRIGDVLLATPLARALKRAWPEAELHFLVFQGTEGVLQGNPDIDKIIAYPHRTDWRGKLAQWRELWRNYDLALSPIASDRARLYGWVGASFRVGFINPGEHGKTLLLNRWLRTDNLTTHTVTLGLRLAELLGIAPAYQVTPPIPSLDECKTLAELLTPVKNREYVVLHPSPKFSYKMWRQDGWVELARWLQRQGLAIVLTGGPDADEKSYAENIAQKVSALNLSGKLSLAGTAELVAHTRLFVGPDTAVTHIAAAVGVPTIAIFGPSNPIKWGPWPSARNQPDSPWQLRGSGRQGNVWLIQGPGDCVPCLLEGCDRHIKSSSACLQQISTSSVITAAGAMLGERSVIPIALATETRGSSE
jgi:heptosyltransferase-3